MKHLILEYTTLEWSPHTSKDVPKRMNGLITRQFNGLFVISFWFIKFVYKKNLKSKIKW